MLKLKIPKIPKIPKMFKKFTTETAIITAGVLTTVSSIYNNERSISNSSNNIEIEKFKELESKVDNLSKKMDTILDKLNVGQSASPTTSTNISTTTPEAINLDNALQNSMLDYIMLNVDLQFSFSIILFSLAALSATLGLTCNLFIAENKDLLENKMFRTLAPIFKYYLGKSHYILKYNLMVICISLIFIFILSLYMNLRGVA